MAEQSIPQDESLVVWAETLEELKSRFKVEDFPEWPEPVKVAELKYLLLKEMPGLMHRGLSWEEMQEIRKTGVVQSRGDQVQFVPGHHGLTFYSRDPGDCWGFAEHATDGRRPTFNYPHYIVTVHCPPKQNTNRNRQIR